MTWTKWAYRESCDLAVPAQLLGLSDGYMKNWAKAMKRDKRFAVIVSKPTLIIVIRYEKEMLVYVKDKS